MGSILLNDISKRFTADGAAALSSVTLDIKDGEFIVLVGPSGCGKTTLLRIVAGLESADEGEVMIDGEKVTQVRSGDRNIAMVFQNYALFPHLTVEDNIGFGLRIRGIRKTERQQRVTEAATLLGLDELLDRRPGELSGGQRQRVAMGRAIVRHPVAFLMDEPLSNLDAKLRVEMRAQISRLQKALAATTIYVTHDQTEAMTMGDRVVVLDRGVVQQVGPPAELYEHPANVFVARFIGAPMMNLLRGTCQNGALQIADCRVENRSRRLDSVTGEVLVGVRPEHVGVVPDASREAVLAADVVLVEHLGKEAHVHLSLHDSDVCVDDGDMIAIVDPADAPGQGATVYLSFDMDRAHFFAPDSGAVMRSAQSPEHPAARRP